MLILRKKDIVFKNFYTFKLLKIFFGKTFSKALKIKAFFISLIARNNFINNLHKYPNEKHSNKFENLLIINLVSENLRLKACLESLNLELKDSKNVVKETTEILQNLVLNDKRKCEFYANMSHELKTPLNMIHCSVQLLNSLDKDYLTSQKNVQNYLNIISQNSLRLLKLINNLLDKSKIEAGSFNLNLKNQNIIYVVEDIVMSTKEYANSKEIQLIFDTNVEEKIMAFDHDLLERILLNLISNAVKFTDIYGKILVNIYDCNEYIKISVKDTGIGIPEDKLNTIFHRYTQIYDDMHTQTDGNGLGLSIVKSLVELHGGQISVSSKLGCGSEFIIHIPVRLIDSQENTINSTHLASKRLVNSTNIEFSDV